MKRNIHIILLCLLYSVAGVAQDEIQKPDAATYFGQVLASWRAGNVPQDNLVLSCVLEACGLMDELAKVEDMEYARKLATGEVANAEGMREIGSYDTDVAYVPQQRKYGYTIFAETDAYWREQGLNPAAADLLPKLVKWIGEKGQMVSGVGLRTDDNYSSEEHLLYQWITYHILPMRITPNRLVFPWGSYEYSNREAAKVTVPVYEYYTTMGQRRLLKLIETDKSGGVCLNRFPNVNNGRKGDGRERDCDADKEGVLINKEQAMVDDMANCIVYPISQPLGYSDAVRSQLGQERLRFDFMSLLPEAMTNDIRRKQSYNQQDWWIYMMPTSMYPYYENLTVSDDTYLMYCNVFGRGWTNLNEDELEGFGAFDITVKLPPVPVTGIYELRSGYPGAGNRTVTNCYLGTDPQNLPALVAPWDMTMSGFPSSSNKVGYLWKTDTGIDVVDAQADQGLRAIGTMKAPNSIAISTNPSKPLRSQTNAKRIILCRQEFKAGETYYLRFKCAVSPSKNILILDYLELCPESVYANPERPEDIW